MDPKIFCFFLAALLSISAQVSGFYDTYRGAVVEYSPVIGANDEDTLAKNVAEYIRLMEEARKKGADIIVFPESGLHSKQTSLIPDPTQRIAPCDSNFEASKALKDLSKASKTNGIYSVVNLPEKRPCDANDPDCPKLGYYVFNTNVVFDRSGVVVARYAKYNLFESDIANKPPEPELSFFDTDFGVRFGTFICFDIIFATPPLKLVQQYGITDFVFSTYWFSELPFLTALQAQRGWAEGNNVNLLASGVSVPSTGSGGSGIYNGKFGHLVQIMPEKPTTKLLIADVPKIRTSSCPRETVPNHGRFSAFSESAQVSTVGNEKDESSGPLALLKNPQLNMFNSEVIKSGEFRQTICGAKKFCCDFKVTMDDLRTTQESKNYTYRAVIYNGGRQFGSKFRGAIQTCGVIFCSGPKIEDCGYRVKNISGLFNIKEIVIKGNFNWKNSFQMPSTLTDGKELVPLSANKYEFVKTEKDKTIEASLELLWPVIDLHTFAIWGRDFTRENEAAVPESGAPAMVSAPFLFATFLSFILFVR